MLRSQEFEGAEDEQQQLDQPPQLPPSHDFAFYEWNFERQSSPDLSATTTCNYPHHYSTPSEERRGFGRLNSSSSSRSSCNSSGSRPPANKTSIEDLMRPSIYKSLLSRELGGTTDLEWHKYTQVPREVIELDGHQAIGTGGTARQFTRRERQQRLSIESKLQELPRRATYPAKHAATKAENGSSACRRARTASIGEGRRVAKFLSKLSLKRNK